MSRRASPTIPLPIRCSWPTAAMDPCTASRAPTSRRSTLSSLAPTSITSASTPRPAAWSSVTATAPSPWSTAASGKPATEIRLPGHPEFFQLERGGPRIFVNVPDAHQITVVDRSTGRQVASWGLADAQANFPMALNEAAGRLAVGYREPALLAVFDTGSGAPVARVPACGDTDDVFVDPKRHRLYLSCGAGFLEVIQQRDDTYEDLARIRPSRAPELRCSCRSGIVSISRSGPAAARARPSGFPGPRLSLDRAGAARSRLCEAPAGGTGGHTERAQPCVRRSTSARSRCSRPASRPGLPASDKLSCLRFPSGQSR